MINFGRRLPYNGARFPNTPIGPASPYGQESPAGAPAATAGPMIPMGGGGGGGVQSRFQQSLDNERATTAQSAATFAAAAPLPMTDAASAYGSVAASQAARNAYVGRQQNVSNAQDFAGLGPNYFRNQMVEDQGIDRANAESGAKVGLMGAQGGLLKAQGEDLAAKAIIYPAQAADAMGRAHLNDANATSIPLITGAKVKDLEAGVVLKNAQGQAATTNATAGTAGIPLLKSTVAQRDQDLRRANQRISHLEGLLGKKDAYGGAPPTTPYGATQTQQPAQPQPGRPITPSDDGGEYEPTPPPRLLTPQAPPAPPPQPASQPTAGATHYNPTTGEKWSLDPKSNRWVRVGG